MPAPSYTYTLTNGTTADASQVMQDFSDILNGVTDGTKDLSIAALTVAGTATLNGNVNLGNSSADDLTITGSLAATLPIKTNNAVDIGSASLALRKLYSAGVNANTLDPITSTVGTEITARTSGVTMPIGKVGYIVTATDSSSRTQASPVLLTYYDITGLSISLDAGDWDVWLDVDIAAAWASGASSLAQAYGVLRDGSNTVLATAGACRVGDGAGYTTNSVGHVHLYYRALLTSTTTIKASMRMQGIAGSAVINEIGAPNNLSAAKIVARLN